MKLKEAAHNPPSGGWHTTSRCSHSLRIVAAVAYLLSMAAVTPCCTPPERAPFAEVRHLPENGWPTDLPLSFEPQLPDSTNLSYNVDLVVRHDDSFPFSSILLTVDMVGDSAQVLRYSVRHPLTDDRGNWTGAGFGALYQHRVRIASDVSATALHRVVIWNTTDTAPTPLRGVRDIALQIVPQLGTSNQATTTVSKK